MTDHAPSTTVGPGQRTHSMSDGCVPSHDDEASVTRANAPSTAVDPDFVRAFDDMIAVQQKLESEVARLTAQLAEVESHRLGGWKEASAYRERLVEAQSELIQLRQRAESAEQERDQLSMQFAVPCTDLSPHDAYCSGGPRCVKAMREGVEEQYADEHNALQADLAQARAVVVEKDREIDDLKYRLAHAETQIAHEWKGEEVIEAGRVEEEAHLRVSERPAAHRLMCRLGKALAAYDAAQQQVQETTT